MERLKIHERIGILRAKQGMSGEEFAAALGLEGKNRRSTINNWESGANNVKADDIENICRVFGVSADWLLGLSDIETPNAEVQAICNYTGLSESAVEHLHTCVEQLNPENTYFNIVSDLLSGDDFYNAIAYLKRAKQMEEKSSEKRKVDPDSFDKIQAFHESLADMAVMRNKSGQGVYLSLRQSVDFYLQCAVDCYKRLCDSMLKGVDK